MWRLGWLAGLLLVLLVGFEAYVFSARHLEQAAPVPGNLGNHAANRDRAHAGGRAGAFSFAVVGDTKSHGTFERIAEGLRDEHLSFLVLLGDVVRDAVEPEHVHARGELAEMDLPFPVFWIPGNHDVDPDRFSLAQFERWYGPSNFWFTRGDCLFLFLRALPRDGRNAETVAYATEVLSAERAGSRRAFVFLHIPPPVSQEFHGRALPESDRLLEIFERFDVDYVIAGDYHGQARIERHGVRYVISGGGGAALEGAKFGAFHHAMVFDVEGDQVVEKFLVVDREWDAEDVAERLAIVRFAPWLDRRKHWLLAVHVVLAIAWLARRGGGPGQPVEPACQGAPGR